MTTLIISSQAKQLTETNLQFALNMLKKDKNSTGNMMISPFSIGLGLGMVYAGANSHTSKEMEHVLQLQSFEDESAVHTLFDKLITIVKRQTGSNVTLLTANRLYLQNGMKLTPLFLKTLEKKYHSEVGLVDFVTKYDSLGKKINKWVEGMTNNKIKDIITDGVLDQFSCLVLVNAVYYEANWAEEFKLFDTRLSAFHLDKSTKISVEMMNMTKDLAYGFSGSLNCKILEMPYVNSNLSMYFILPVEIEGLSKLEQKLEARTISEMIQSMQIREVKVALPKFKMECCVSLSNILCDMGMTSLFDEDNADLSSMCNAAEGLSVSAVIHKTLIQVTEEGTVPSAALKTQIVGWCESGTDNYFFMDRPFLFLIREKASGTVLFLGRLTNPL